MFKRLHFDEEAQVHLMPNEDVVSPKTTSETELFPIVGKSSTLAVPAKPNRPNSKVDASPDEPLGSSPALSNASSAHTATSTNPGINIREVAPWIDYDAGLTIPSPSEDSPDRPMAQSLKTRDTKQATKSLKATTPNSTFYGCGSPLGDDLRHARRKSGDFKGIANLNPSKKDTRKSIFVKTRNPMAKLFDGAEDDDDDDDFSASNGQFSPEPQSNTSRLLFSTQPSHTVFGPKSRFPVAPRDGISPTKNPTRAKSSPFSMKNFISQPMTATFLDSPISTPTLECPAYWPKDISEDSQAEQQLRKMMKQLRKLDIRGPFDESRRESVAGVSAHVESAEM
jgi:hypothetical protein